MKYPAIGYSLVSLTKSHRNVFLRDILSLYDVAEPAFFYWITITPVVPILCVLLLLSVSSSLVFVVILIAVDLLGSVNRDHCNLCGGRFMLTGAREHQLL